MLAGLWVWENWHSKNNKHDHHDEIEHPHTIDELSAMLMHHLLVVNQNMESKKQVYQREDGQERLVDE